MRECRLGLGKSASGLAELAGRGLGLDLEQDLIPGDRAAGADVELDHRAHDPTRDSGLSGGLDHAANLDSLGLGDPLDLGHLDAEGLQVGLGERWSVVTTGGRTEGRNGHSDD
jgi:hypothetical protein